MSKRAAVMAALLLGPGSMIFYVMELAVNGLT